MSKSPKFIQAVKDIPQLLRDLRKLALIVDNKVSIGDRGDPSASDFTTTDFVKDSDWHDLDFSAIVPTGTRVILFKATIQSDGVGDSFRLRKNGNTNIVNTFSLYTQVANELISGDGMCFLDADRKAEYYLTTSASATWATIFLRLKGWIL